MGATRMSSSQADKEHHHGNREIKLSEDHILPVSRRSCKPHPCPHPSGSSQWASSECPVPFFKASSQHYSRECRSGGISQQCKPHGRWQPVSEFLWAWAQPARVHHLLSQRHKKACIPFRQIHVLKHGRPVFSLSPQVLRNPPTLCFSRNELRLSSALSPLLRSP